MTETFVNPHQINHHKYCYTFDSRACRGVDHTKLAYIASVGYTTELSVSIGMSTALNFSELSLMNAGCVMTTLV